MSTQHTPGPWRWHYDAGYNKGYIYTPEHRRVWDGREKAMVDVIDEQKIAIVNPDWCHSSEIVATTTSCQANWEQVEANGRLMAAAPDLLAELEAMVQHFSWYGIKDDNDAQRLQDARAAIAKAKGEPTT